FLFEALCERDLKLYAQALGGQLYHYQDYKNNELDAVVQLLDGRWGAFEIKLGAHQIDEAAEKLVKMQSLFKQNQGPEPTVLCVVCGISNAAYKRPDGVYVVPITALKP
ncbi:MAG TPA: ATPase, partial [Bacteroidales bacterium]|nr:ATPase [Bacteroidales bacterium]